MPKYKVTLKEGQRFIPAQKVQDKLGKQPLVASNLNQEQLKTLFDAGCSFVVEESEKAKPPSKQAK